MTSAVLDNFYTDQARGLLRGCDQRRRCGCAIALHSMEGFMKTIVSVVAAGVVLCSVGLLVIAQNAHVMVDQKEAKWGPAPPMLPTGAQIAVLAGDPTKSTAYTIRLKFPANYAIPAHSHPTDEHVVVTSGAVTFGMGDKLAKGAASNKTLAPGGFALM